MENYDPRKMLGGFDPMQERIGLALSAHAVRYLAATLKRERERLARKGEQFGGYGVADEATYDSLDELESSIPARFWD
jgi:hypothetical protein